MSDQQQEQMGDQQRWQLMSPGGTVQEMPSALTSFASISTVESVAFQELRATRQCADAQKHITREDFKGIYWDASDVFLCVRTLAE